MPVPAKFDKSQIVPLPAGVPRKFDKSQIQAVNPAASDALTDTGAPTGPSLIDKLTEIQKPDPNHPLDYHEALKAIGNIGAGGMGMILHPYDTVASAVKLGLNANPAAYLYHRLTGTPDPVAEMAKQFSENPYGTVEAGIGQAAVAEALPHVLKPVVGKASDVAKAGIRRVAGSGPGVADKLARRATEENRVIDLHNADKLTEANQKWADAQAKAATDHKAELLRLRQKYAQDTRNAVEKARTGTAADREQYQAKQLAAKQAYDQSVRDANEKFKTDVEKARQENAEAQRKYNRQIGKTVRQNRAVSEAQSAATERAARLQVGGSQLIYRLNQLDRALRDRAGQMYDAIREKVGNATLPGNTLGAAAQDAMSKIHGTSETPRVFRDILGKYPAAEPEFIDYQGAKIPRGTPLYNTLVEHGAVEATPLTFADLQGYYSELGKELSKGTLPGDVYQATKALQESVGDMMQEMAAKAGMEKQLVAARKFYRNYMDVFHEPAGPSGSGSPVAQALLAKDPLHAVQAFGEKSGARGVADLRRYDDSLANLAQDLYRDKSAQVRVPAGGKKAIADIPQPQPKPVPGGPSLPLPPVLEPEPVPHASNLPLPPVMPEVEEVPYKAPKLAPRKVISAEDLQRANEEAVRKRAAGLAGHLFWWTGVWPAFRMLSELTRGAEVSLKPMALMPAAGATGMAVEEIMRQPPVMEFLTRATRQQVARIPPELRGSMPQIVAAAKARGVQVSPILAAYASTVQRNQNTQQEGPQ